MSALSARSDRWQFLRPYLALLWGERPLSALLLVWPAACGLWLASNGVPSWRLLLGFALGLLLAQAALVLGQSLASPESVAPSQRQRWIMLAIVLLLLMGLFALGDAVTFQAGLLGLGIWALGPLVRRFSYLGEIHQGVVFAWGVVMAFACASDEPLQPQMGLAALASMVWAASSSVWWTMATRSRDLAADKRTTAILLGDMDRVAQAVLLLGALAAWGLLGDQGELGFLFLIGLGLAALLLAWAWWQSRGRHSITYSRAGDLTAWAGGLVFLGMVLALV